MFNSPTPSFPFWGVGIFFLCNACQKVGWATWIIKPGKPAKLAMVARMEYLPRSLDYFRKL
jgi:hypothetical protein